MQFRRNRSMDATASPRTRHNGATPAESAESPRPPHAATVTPIDAYSGQYRYDQATLTDLYAEGRGLLAEADGNERRANELLADVDALLGLAARQRVRAADRFRLLRLAELDAVTPEGAVWPTAAPQVPQEPPVLEHFHDGILPYAPCGDGGPFQTSDPSLVTCPACRARLAERMGQPPKAEPRPEWAPPRPPANGWGEQADLPDTLTMPAVGAR